MNINNGPVHNWYIKKLMDKSNKDLEEIAYGWENASLVKKVLDCFNLLESHQIEYLAARDILEARNNPDGETAKKINWRIEDYRKENEEIRRGYKKEPNPLLIGWWY